MTSSRELSRELGYYVSPIQRWCNHVWDKWVDISSLMGSSQSERICVKCHKKEYK